MTDLKPEPGLVFRYDFLFEREKQSGRDAGKDRPCALMLLTRTQNHTQKALICPITHSPPRDQKDGIEIPRKICQSLGLDDHKMWVKVNALNRLTWEENMIPYGASFASQEKQAYGYLPPKFYETIKNAVLNHAKSKSLSVTERDD